MGKMDRLRNRVEPFCCPVFGLSAIYEYVLAATPDSAVGRHHSTAEHETCPYMVIVGFSTKTRVLPPFF